MRALLEYVGVACGVVVACALVIWTGAVFVAWRFVPITDTGWYVIRALLFSAVLFAVWTWWQEEVK